MSLKDAVYALSEIASGAAPDRYRLVTGAQALEALRARGPCDRDLNDAAFALTSLAHGFALEFDKDTQRRAAELAAAVRGVLKRP